MAVSRNLAINSLSSKLEPFIRGHDLPKCPIVNDDDADDDVEDDVDVDYDTDFGDGDGDGDGDCVDACNLAVQFTNELCTLLKMEKQQGSEFTKQEMMQQSVKVERSGLLWQWLPLFITCDRLAISRADPYTTKSPLQTKDDDGKESSNTMVIIIVMIIKMIINVRIITIIKISACDFPHLPLLPCCLF